MSPHQAEALAAAPDPCPSSVTRAQRSLSIFRQPSLLEAVDFAVVVSGLGGPVVFLSTGPSIQTASVVGDEGELSPAHSRQCTMFARLASHRPVRHPSHAAPQHLADAQAVSLTRPVQTACPASKMPPPISHNDPLCLATTWASLEVFGLPADWPTQLPIQRLRSLRSQARHQFSFSLNLHLCRRSHPSSSLHLCHLSHPLSHPFFHRSHQSSHPLFHQSHQPSLPHSRRSHPLNRHLSRRSRSSNPPRSHQNRQSSLHRYRKSLLLNLHRYQRSLQLNPHRCHRSPRLSPRHFPRSLPSSLHRFRKSRQSSPRHFPRSLRLNLHRFRKSRQLSRQRCPRSQRLALRRCQ